MAKVIDLNTFVTYDNEDPEDTARAKALIKEVLQSQEPPVKLWDDLGEKKPL